MKILIDHIGAYKIFQGTQEPFIGMYNIHNGTVSIWVTEKDMEDIINLKSHKRFYPRSIEALDKLFSNVNTEALLDIKFEPENEY